MSDSSVNEFLGETNDDVPRSSDRSINKFLGATNDYENYPAPSSEQQSNGGGEQSSSPSWWDMLANVS